MGVLHAAAELGVAVPGHLSVTGFDDIPMASYLVPPLTTVHMPVGEMTAAAAALAMDEPQAESEAPVQTFVAQPSLVVRGSTGEAPPGA